MQTERIQSSAALLAEEMRAIVSPVRVQAGEVVVSQGREGYKFYYVESGALDVVITSEEDLRLPVARLGPGSHFGEMSLLAGIPISADVVASETSILYMIDSKNFNELIQQKPALVEYLASELAIRLKRTNTQLAAQQQRQAVLSRLISLHRSSTFKQDLLSFGKRMAEAIGMAVASDTPLLITGEKGVGKKTLAQHIYCLGMEWSKSVLLVDCRELPPNEAKVLLFGDAQPDSVNRFADHLGYLQAADRGTLILAHIDRLPPAVQDDLATFLHSKQDSSGDFHVAVRVIGTVDINSSQTDALECLSDALAHAFANGQMIQLQPLRQRRRDIIPLAEHFLQQAAHMNGMPLQRLEESAKRKLLSYDFRFENVAELKNVVNLGLDLAEGQGLSAEHLFFGAGIEAEGLQLDLLRWSWVEQLLARGRFLKGAKVAVGIAFLALFGACFLAPSSLIGQVSNMLVWGFWWPGLIVASIFLGRVWCAICPLSSGAEAVQQIQQSRGRGLSPLSRLKDAWPIPALIGFAAIIWIEYSTDMQAHPRATGMLLLGLAVCAATIGWLYQRHTWCRYICPLGAMCAVFSTISALRVRARREVCHASCTGNECYKGSENTKGCPMFNHAMFLNSGEYCKLCMECLHACPARSPRLILQFPLRDIWHSNLISTEAVPLTVVVGIMALLLAASPLINSFSPWGFTLGTLVAVAVGLALLRVFQSSKQTENIETLSWTGRVVHAFVPAVAVVLLNFHLLSTAWLGEVFLRMGRSNGDLLQISLLHAVQGMAIGLGALMTLWALWRLCRQRFGPTMVRAFRMWIPLGILAIVYLTSALVLLIRVH